MKKQAAKLLDMPTRRESELFAVQSRIVFLRQQRVILDVHLAELYGVTVKRLNEQVKRNHDDSLPISCFGSRLKRNEL